MDFAVRFFKPNERFGFYPIRNEYSMNCWEVKCATTKPSWYTSLIQFQFCWATLFLNLFCTFVPIAG